MDFLTDEQIEEFIQIGFIKIDNAFPSKLADRCREILWRATRCDPNDRSTWTKPVIRIGELTHEPFVQAANTPVLVSAYDQLVGQDNWIPKTSLGSFPIRFPSNQSANDTGWHVDASFPGDNSGNYLEWRINIHSKGRGLLMLFLFSDVTELDAPTRIKVGSHLNAARLLSQAGETGLSFMELAELVSSLPGATEVLATGSAGTVYLCHPFLVHAAQEHHGTSPKFMAQPALFTVKDFDIHRPTGKLSPVEPAILKGLNNDLTPSQR